MTLNQATKNFAIFSGTFNPIHIAHLIIAQNVREKLNLNKVIFIPSYAPPHKGSCKISPEHRLNMINLAIEDNLYFASSDIEIKREEKSYSYLTMKQLLSENNLKDRINFIIGSDAFNFIDSWYEIDKLKSLVRFIILNRPSSPKKSELFQNIKLKDFEYKYVDVPMMDISSSDIRKKIKQNKAIKYLVHHKVENYIYKNCIYR